MKRIWLCVWALGMLAGCAAEPSAVGPVAPKDAPAASTQGADVDYQSEARWDLVSRKIGKGTFKDGVYTITLPRNDLEVNHIEFGPLPPGAGLESRMFFWACECGKAMVVGHLCVADYEVNDVIDELRAGNISVTGMSPLFVGDKPHVLSLNFQGEGADDMVVPALVKALHWMGKSAEPLK